MPPTATVVRRIQWFFWPTVALLLSGIVVQASYSAFSAKVSNSGNTLGAGTVALADDDSGSALFSAANLKPGATGSKCITVTSSGSLPSTVKLYTTSTGTTNSLSSYLTMSVVMGSGGSFSSCSGFSATTGSGAVSYSATLAKWYTDQTSYSNGLTTWSPGGGGSESRTFQFSYTLSSSAPDSAQGGTATFAMTWEAQST